MGYSGHEYELSEHLNTAYNSFAPARVLRTGAFYFSQKVFEKLCYSIWHSHGISVEDRRKGINNLPPGTRGGENMEPNRTEWQKRCTFNGFCKKVLKNEAIDAIRENRTRRKREVVFSELTPQEESQLYTYDHYFAEETGFQVAGKWITPKLLADALNMLPEEKRQAVLLYYFFDMSDVEIAGLMKIPRSTVQYRRTSSFELLKRYLEERADEWSDW